MKKVGLFVVTAAMLLVNSPSSIAKASAAPMESDLGAWSPITLQVPIHRKLSSYFEIQPRWQQLAQHHFSELQVRSGLAWELNKNWSVSGGYFWAPRFNPKLNMEHQLWQQLSYLKQVGHFRLQNRARLEEIWRESYSGPSLCLRNQVKVSYQLGKSPWYAVAWEEPFANINNPENGPERGFNQNLLFVGMGRKLGETTRVECGYLNQYKNGQHGNYDQFNHVLLAQVSIDLRKLKLPQSWKLAGKTPRGVTQ